MQLVVYPDTKLCVELPIINTAVILTQIGTVKTYPAKTNRVMSKTVSKSPQIAFPYQLKKVDLLIRSVIFLWVFGAVNIQSARATSLKSPAKRSQGLVAKTILIASSKHSSVILGQLEESFIQQQSAKPAAPPFQKFAASNFAVENTLNRGSEPFPRVNSKGDRLVAPFLGIASLPPTQPLLPVPPAPIPSSGTASVSPNPPPSLLQQDVPRPSSVELPTSPLIQTPLTSSTAPVRTWQAQVQAGSVSGGSSYGYGSYLPVGQPNGLPPIQAPPPVIPIAPTWQEQLQYRESVAGGSPYGSYSPVSQPALPPIQAPPPLMPIAPTWQEQVQSKYVVGGSPYGSYSPVTPQATPLTQTQTPLLPSTLTPLPGDAPGPNFNPPTQTPLLSPTLTPLPGDAPGPNFNPPTQTPNLNAAPADRTRLRPTDAVTSSALQLQGVYLYQGGQSSARARAAAIYPLTPNLLFGATLDLTSGNGFSDSQDQGLSINELYLATSVPGVPNLRFVGGKLDLTSYFDRNSFAKDGATQFFNTVFQTNPALSAANISSRPGLLVNFSPTDNIEAKAAVFSSSRTISNFSLDGFAGEVGVRYGNAIIRGTYVSSRDATLSGFREIFGAQRSGNSGQFGPRRTDQQEGYGVNAEAFVPNLNLGVFGRYGRYNNFGLGKGGDTYSAGLSLFDLFTPYDRLGLAYGQDLSNALLRRQSGAKRPDVLELFYDFRFLPSLRLGFSVEERNAFSETIFGFRVKTEFDVAPIGKLGR